MRRFIPLLVLATSAIGLAADPLQCTLFLTQQTTGANRVTTYATADTKIALDAKDPVVLKSEDFDWVLDAAGAPNKKLKFEEYKKLAKSSLTNGLEVQLQIGSSVDDSGPLKTLSTALGVKLGTADEDFVGSEWESTIHTAGERSDVVMQGTFFLPEKYLVGGGVRLIVACDTKKN